MDATRTTKYLSKLNGVEGNFICTPPGSIISCDMPGDHEQASLEEFAKGAAMVIETYRAQMKDCYELKFVMDRRTIYIRKAKCDLMVILVDDSDCLEDIRISAHVAAEQYRPEETPENEAQPVVVGLTDHINHETDPRSENEDIPKDRNTHITSSSFTFKFEDLKKRTAPDNEEETHWC